MHYLNINSGKKEFAAKVLVAKNMSSKEGIDTTCVTNIRLVLKKPLPRLSRQGAIEDLQQGMAMVCSCHYDMCNCFEGGVTAIKFLDPHNIFVRTEYHRLY